MYFFTAFTFPLSVSNSNKANATSTAVAGPVDVIIFLSITILSSFTIAPKSASCFLLIPSNKSYVVAFLFFNIPDFATGRAATQTDAIIFPCLSKSRIRFKNLSSYASS